MKEVIVKLYSFEELSDKAKEKAHEWYTYTDQYAWGDDAIKSLEKFAEHFNCSLNSNYEIDWLEWYRTSASFDVPDYVKDYSEKELRDLIKSMGSYNKKTLMGNGDCKFTGFCSDEDAADGARKAFFNGERDVKELLNAGFKTWWDACKADYEYQLSMEAFAETCEANEWQFTEDGEFWKG